MCTIYNLFYLTIYLDSGFPEIFISLQLFISNNNEQIYSLYSLLSVLPVGIKII